MISRLFLLSDFTTFLYHISMSFLINIESIPEGLDISNLHLKVCEEFTHYREQNQQSNLAPIQDEIIFLVQVALIRSNEPTNFLYKCGLMFLQEFISVNLSKLTVTLSLNNAVLSQRIKNWNIKTWDLKHKKLILSQYEDNPDLRSWSLRKPHDCDKLKEILSREISVQTTQILYEANPVPPPTSQPCGIDLQVLRLRDFNQQVIYDQPSFTWEFDVNPKKSLYLF